MKPMLAKTFDKAKFKLTFPCFVQPKLDGLRGMWLRNQLHSRDNARVKNQVTRESDLVWDYDRLPHIYHELHGKFPGFQLDGEMYAHGLSLQQINSIASVNSTKTHKDHLLIKFHVFDVINPQPQNERFIFLDNFWEGCQHIVRVPTFIATDMDFLNSAHKWFQDQGYEGSMIRDFSAPYGYEQNCTNQENRWNTLLKRKDWLDVLCECVGIEEGEGKYTGLVGSLQLRLPDDLGSVIFTAGTGLTDEQRRRYSTNPPIGCMVKIEFKCLTDGGNPREPKVVCVFDESSSDN
jgi:ATP-dependent DNA ligase